MGRFTDFEAGPLVRPYSRPYDPFAPTTRGQALKAMPISSASRSQAATKQAAQDSPTARDFDGQGSATCEPYIDEGSVSVADDSCVRWGAEILQVP